jgi:DNA-binding MarR family transcriptional regulator
MTVRGSQARASKQEVDAVLDASRSLVGIAARSIGELPESVTLPQFRALVVLSGVGATPIGDLAAELNLHPSTATRLVDRLVQRKLVRRAPEGADRRQSHVLLTDHGEKLVMSVTRRRVRDITRVLDRMSPTERRSVAHAMATFASAAGSLADASWELGWEAR